MTSPSIVAPDLGGRTRVVVERDDGTQRVFATYVDPARAEAAARLFRAVGAVVRLEPENGDAKRTR